MGKACKKRTGILAALLDLIYPPVCPLCGRFTAGETHSQGTDTTSFCAECSSTLKPINPPFCKVCSVPLPPGRDDEPICGACLRKRPAYRAAWAPFVYEGAAAEAIKQLKYEKKTSLAPLLANLMAPLAERKVRDLERPLVMPVPLHPRRLRERGYNQSLLLARALADIVKLDLDYLSLRRIRHTSPQMALGMDKRHTNVRGAFKVKDDSKWAGRDILLIDDVATTGTTLNECALALMEAGAKAVACLTFAKAAL